MKKQQELKVQIMVPKGDGYVDYDTLSDEEKKALAISIRKRMIRSLAQARGYDVHFTDEETDKTVTA